MIQLLLLAVLVQTPTKGQVEKFRKEAVVLEDGINDAVESAVPGYALLHKASSFYVNGHGAFFTLDVQLEPTRNPFSSQKTPKEVRTIVTERRKIVREKIVELIKTRAVSLDSVGSTESITVVLNLLNTNPADLPDLPSQLLITVKKQDALDFRDNKLSAAEFVAKINAGILEF